MSTVSVTLSHAEITAGAKAVEYYQTIQKKHTTNRTRSLPPCLVCFLISLFVEKMVLDDPKRVRIPTENTSYSAWQLTSLNATCPVAYTYVCLVET